MHTSYTDGMQKETLRNRVASLARKSRKAIALYQSVEKREKRSFAQHMMISSELADRSMLCWREVNTDLYHKLQEALRISAHKELVQELYHIRDHFYSQWRMEESKLARGVHDIELALEQRDFIRACRVAEFLALTKASAQASEAASAELQNVLEATTMGNDLAVSYSSDVGYQALSGQTLSGQTLPEEFAELAEHFHSWGEQEGVFKQSSGRQAHSGQSHSGQADGRVLRKSAVEQDKGNIIPLTRVSKYR